MTWSLIYWRILQAVPAVGHPPSWQQLHLQGSQPLPGAGQQLHHHQQPPWHPPMLLSRPAQCLLARYAQVQHCELSTQAAPCPLQHASQELFSHFHLVHKPDNALSSSMHLITSSFPPPLRQPVYFFSPLQAAV